MEVRRDTGENLGDDPAPLSRGFPYQIYQETRAIFDTPLRNFHFPAAWPVESPIPDLSKRPAITSQFASWNR
jgi:hypothetical protein